MLRGTFNFNNLLRQILHLGALFIRYQRTTMAPAYQCSFEPRMYGSPGLSSRNTCLPEIEL